MKTESKYTFEQLSVLVATIAKKWDYTMDYHSSDDKFVTFSLPEFAIINSFFLGELESTLELSVLVEAKDNRLLIIIANY